MEDAWSIVKAVPLPPTVVVYTGGGMQVYWLFREPWQLDGDKERKKAKALSKRFQQYLQHYALQRAGRWTARPICAASCVFRARGTGSRALRFWSSTKWSKAAAATTRRTSRSFSSWKRIRN